MSLPLVLRPEAESDIISARAWYEEQRPGLGDDFIGQVARALDGIAEHPTLYAAAWADVRSCRLRRYPYVVYYRILTDRTEVLAVFHGSRHPDLWQSRATR